MSCNFRRILQLNDAIQYREIKVLDVEKIDITGSCKYSWSTDGVCWTSWANIDTYNLICKNIESDFYLRVLLFGSFSQIFVGSSFTECYSICVDSGTQFLDNFCQDSNTFQPYNNLDCALQLQQQLSDSIVCMLGIPIFYFRVNPEKDTIDYTFKEYFLRKVDSVKQLKLMIPDGQMPSSNPKLTELDFDWDTDWETELSKTQFANAFGDDAFPKKGDFLYIPMMKRMWEVNAAYDEKNEGLMWRSTTWKLALIKYSDNTSVDTGIFDSLIDGWVQSYAETFGEKEIQEQERETGAQPLSAPTFSATNLFDIFMEDAVRQQYTYHDISILDKTYNHKSLVVARNIYKPKNENGCVVYQKPICGDEGSLMFIIETGGSLNGELERDILNFGNIQIRVQWDGSNEKFILKFGDLSQYLDLFKSYMVIVKWNRHTFSTELCIYNYTHPTDIPVYRVRPEMYEFDFNNPVCESVGLYNNDYVIDVGMKCSVHSYPFCITNIKFYNTYLSREDAMKESVKYTTKHDNCVINDLARPINSGHGYTVK